MDDAREQLLRRVAGDLGRGESEAVITTGRLPEALSELPLPEGTEVVGVISGPAGAGGAPEQYQVYLATRDPDACTRLTAALEAGGWTRAHQSRAFLGGFTRPLPPGARRVPDQFQSSDGRSTAHLSEAAPGNLTLYIRRFPHGSPHLGAQQLHQQFSLPQLTSTPEVQVSPGGMSGGGGGRNYRIIMTATIQSGLSATEVVAQLGCQLEAGGWRQAEVVSGGQAALHTYQISEGEYQGLGWLSITHSPDGTSYFGTCGAEFQFAAERSATS